MQPFAVVLFHINMLSRMHICKFRRAKLLGMMSTRYFLSIDYYEADRNQSAEEDF